MIEPVVVAGAGLGDVNRGINAALGQLAVQADLHVAGAFEFLENHVIQTAFRFHKGGREDGQRAAFLDISRRAEKLARLLQRHRTDAARADRAALHRRIVAAGEAGEAVQQEDHVLALLDEPLGPLDDEIRDLRVAAGRLVKGRGEHLRANGFLEIGDLFRPLVEQQDDELGVRVVHTDRAGDLLE